MTDDSTRPPHEFPLDARLARDSESLLRLALCDVRLSHDARWPWLVLVPQRPGAEEIFDLSPEEQMRLSQEVAAVGAALKRASGALKINIGALGNIVRQLHVHVIARQEGDTNWPGPIWGFGTPEPWEPAARAAFCKRLRGELS